MNDSSRFDFQRVLNDAKAVLFSPREFFRNLSKTGGYAEPAIFVVVMGAVAGVVSAIFSILGASGIGGIFAIVLLPIFLLVGSFLGALFMFVIWKLMGTEYHYETAYRCIAYATAAYPLMMLIDVIPYLGAIAASIWWAYLIYIASVEVQKVDAKISMIVLTILTLFSIASSIQAQRTMAQLEDFAEETKESVQTYNRDVEQTEEALEKLGRAMEDSLPDLEKMQELTPEEQGKAVGEFFKGLQQGLEGNVQDNAQGEEK